MLKSDTAHIHIVKFVDHNGVFIEYGIGCTEGIDISKYTSLLNGLLIGNEEG
jgi:hypothetical protein